MRRDGNQWADDLTNEVFDKFDAARRIPVEQNGIEWRVFDRMDGVSKNLYDQIQRMKDASKKRKADGGGSDFPRRYQSGKRKT